MNSLLDDYKAWQQGRVTLNAQEEANFPAGPDGGPGAWEESDDKGCELAHALAGAYGLLVRAAQEVVASWEFGDLAAAVRRLSALVQEP